MRYLLDTHIFLYLAQDNEYLDRNVTALLQDYDNTFYVSAETLRKLVIGYNNRSFSTKKWKTCEELIKAVTSDFGIVYDIEEENKIEDRYGTNTNIFRCA